MTIPVTVNAYGSYFDHVAAMEDYIAEHIKERALVVYYELLKVLTPHSTASLTNVVVSRRLILGQRL